MPVVLEREVAEEPFKGGATYKTLVGDATGSTPVRVGIQLSPPGYRTPLHSHPYMEVITILDGEGEAWMDGMAEGATVRLEPGVTLVLEAGQRHWFGASGTKPLKTIGVHASSNRVVDVHGQI